MPKAKQRRLSLNAYIFKLNWARFCSWSGAKGTNQPLDKAEICQIVPVRSLTELSFKREYYEGIKRKFLSIAG
jgi:hypothetical protein